MSSPAGAGPRTTPRDQYGRRGHAAAGAALRRSRCDAPTARGAGPRRTIPAMPARLVSERLVGRERELAALADALEAAARAEPTTVLVAGTAGIGKSRLFDETARRLDAAGGGIIVLTGAAYPTRSGLPFAPVAAALARHLRPLPDDVLRARVGGWGSELARIAPALRGRLAALDLLPDNPPIVSRIGREARMLEAILGIVSRIAEDGPTLLVLEDVHDADAGTRSALAFLSRAVRDRSLCVAATYEPDRMARDHPLYRTLRSLADGPRPARRIDSARSIGTRSSSSSRRSRASARRRPPSCRSPSVPRAIPSRSKRSSRRAASCPPPASTRRSSNCRCRGSPSAHASAGASSGRSPSPARRSVHRGSRRPSPRSRRWRRSRAAGPRGTAAPRPRDRAGSRPRGSPGVPGSSARMGSRSSRTRRSGTGSRRR